MVLYHSPERWGYVKISGYCGNTLGTKFCCQQEHLVTTVICCKFQKNLFEVWFYIIFFMILYMYIAPGQGHTAPKGQSFDVNRNVFSLHSFVAKLKKVSLKSDFIQFFHDLIHVYSPGAGGIHPQGDIVLLSMETSCHFGHLLLISNHRRQ